MRQDCWLSWQKVVGVAVAHSAADEMDTVEAREFQMSFGYAPGKEGRLLVDMEQLEALARS